MRVESAGGDATACRCSADADAVPGVGLRTSLVKGVELGRIVGSAATIALGCISPTAAETLFVKDEMAHPVQEAASFGCGVLIRGVFELDVSAAVGSGNTESGIAEANFRTRWR